MTRHAEPQVSIVTPMYNGAEFLAECIESVLAQTYRNWDYTIVDNCSTDRSLEIAREYAARDPRIRVVAEKDFLRVIPNHNRALRQISPDSKYCKVVFSDDWLFPECLEKMVDTAERYPTAGLVSAYCLEGRHVICTGLPYTVEFARGRDICREHILNGLYLFGSANTVLYRSDLVRRRQPFYNEANIHADTEVCFALLEESDFAFVHQVLTFTRVREGSLTKVSEELHTDLAGTLRVLTTYGPHFLTPAEWRERLDAHVDEYYRFLGKRLFRRRDERFWRMHAGQLRGSGIGFSRRRVVAGAVSALVRALAPRNAVVDRIVGTERHKMTQEASAWPGAAETRPVHER